MWQSRFAKEPFDLKLFMLRCIDNIKWIFLGALVGALCIGGMYYLKNVTFGGRIPYQITHKLDVTYAKDPDTGLEYSYYVAYTWNDWMKSDIFLAESLKGNTLSMEAEEFQQYYEMTLPSDVRNPYLVITHPDKDMAEQLSAVLLAGLKTFAEEQQEIEKISVIDTDGPVLQVRDIRTFRAVVLGAVIGTFFALFTLAFQLILEESIYLPETFFYRYQIPAAGYVDQEGNYSGEAKAGIEYLFANMEKIGLTAVEPELDLTKGLALFENDRALCLPSVLQVPQSVEYLREQEGNLLLVKAGNGNGKAIESVLYLCEVHDVKITAALLIDADRRLIGRYRFGLHRKKGEK